MPSTSSSSPRLGAAYGSLLPRPRLGSDTSPKQILSALRFPLTGGAFHPIRTAACPPANRTHPAQLPPPITDTNSKHLRLLQLPSLLLGELVRRDFDTLTTTKTTHYCVPPQLTSPCKPVYVKYLRNTPHPTPGNHVAVPGGNVSCSKAKAGTERKGNGMGEVATSDVTPGKPREEERGVTEWGGTWHNTH